MPSNRGSVPIPHTTILIIAMTIKCNKICCTYIGIHILKYESKPVIPTKNIELYKTNLLLNFNQNVYFLPFFKKKFEPFNRISESYNRIYYNVFKYVNTSGPFQTILSLIGN